VAVGVALYGVQFQYTWSQQDWARGEVDTFEVMNAALAGAPGLLGERRVGQALDALVNGLQVAQEVVCPKGC